MKVLIATACRPLTEEASKLFNEQLRGALIAKGSVRIVGGIVWAEGPGCANLAFELNGDSEEEIEKVASAITINLMPSKWGETFDIIPKEDTYHLNDVVN